MALRLLFKCKESKKSIERRGGVSGKWRGVYKLSIEKKQAILLNNIYGLDIDEQAVEVSKLSLYLKLLEDEGREATSKEELFKHSDLKLLPSLIGNIKCGNALVESDYYLGKETSLFEDLDAMRKINVFDWQDREKGFGSIFETGGFDCIIGNPPYVSAGNQVANTKLNKQRKYLKLCGKYQTLHKMWDLYIPFIEKGLSILKNGGVYSSIIPYPFINQSYASAMRNFILQNYNLLELVDLKGTKVFENATVTNCIPIIRKETSEVDSSLIYISHIDEEMEIHISFEKPISELVIDEKRGVWNLERENKDSTRHKDLHVLGDFCYIAEGLHGNAHEKKARGQFKKEDLISEVQDEIHPRKYIEGKDVSRYSIDRVRFFEYGTKRSPTMLRCPTFEEFYYPEKIFINTLGDMTASLDISNQFLHNHKLLGVVLWKELKEIKNRSIEVCVKRFSKHTREEMEELSEKVNLYYLLAILNSNYASHLLSIQRGEDFNIYAGHIRNIPIPIAHSTEMEALSNYAKQELNLHQKLKEAKLPQDKLVIENSIKVLDVQIDELVYKIYGITEEEIAKL